MVQKYKSYLICAMGCVFLGEGKRVLFYEKDTSYLFNEETAVDKDRRSVFAHDDVRFARHALDIQPIPIPMRPQPFPNQNLRFGRLAADMRHAAVALGRCQNIGHGYKIILQGLRICQICRWLRN